MDRQCICVILVSYDCPSENLIMVCIWIVLLDFYIFCLMQDYKIIQMVNRVLLIKRCIIHTHTLSVECSGM